MAKKKGRPFKAGKREPNGRIQRDFKAEREIDVQGDNLKARCVDMNIAPTNANLILMRNPMAGCNAGRALMSNTDGANLFAAVTHFRRVIVAHDRAIDAPSRHPVCVGLLSPPEPFEVTAASAPLDLRTDEEKVRHADAALMLVEKWLGYTDKASASEAKRVCIEDSAIKDLDGLLRALRCICDGLDGKKPIYRGR